MGWISPIEPYKRHNDILSKRLKGTGEWFLQLQDFQDWLKPNEVTSGSTGVGLRFSGCYGKPGAGKSVIW
jgi:hypothetical protein